jgi:hypothetical protein
MTLRVRAMWKHSQGATIAITLLCILNVSNFTITMPYGLITATFGPATFPFTGCTFVPSFRHQYVGFTTCIAFETLVIALTVIGLSSFLHGPHMRLPLVSLLMQDGLIYYFCIISIHFLLFFTGIFANVTWSLPFAMTSPAIAVAGVACNRMLLRLQNVLLSNGLNPSSMRMTEMDVSARIGPDTVLGTIDVDVWDSSATSSRI